MPTAKPEEVWHLSESSPWQGCSSALDAQKHLSSEYCAGCPHGGVRLRQLPRGARHHSAGCHVRAGTATSVQQTGKGPWVLAETPFCVCQVCARLSNPTQPKCTTQAQVRPMVAVGAAAHALGLLFHTFLSVVALQPLHQALDLEQSGSSPWANSMSICCCLPCGLLAGLGLGRHCWKLLSGMAPVLCGSCRCYALLHLCR